MKRLFRVLPDQEYYGYLKEHVGSPGSTTGQQESLSRRMTLPEWKGNLEKDLSQPSD